VKAIREAEKAYGAAGMDWSSINTNLIASNLIMPQPYNFTTSATLPATSYSGAAFAIR
jgi:hypothetical protein